MMHSIQVKPFYHSGIQLARLASLLNPAQTLQSGASDGPPYNIEVTGDDRYAICLALAGFEKDELDIKVEKNRLTIRGEKKQNAAREYLYRGIASQAFEHQFDLEDHIQVIDADLRHGLLSIHLLKEVPEAMKPRTIAIQQDTETTLKTDQAA